MLVVHHSIFPLKAVSLSIDLYLTRLCYWMQIYENILKNNVNPQLVVIGTKHLGNYFGLFWFLDCLIRFDVQLVQLVDLFMSRESPVSLCFLVIESDGQVTSVVKSCVSSAVNLAWVCVPHSVLVGKFWVETRLPTFQVGKVEFTFISICSWWLFCTAKASLRRLFIPWFSS